MKTREHWTESRGRLRWHLACFLAGLVLSFSALADQDLTAYPLENLIDTEVGTAAAASRQISMSSSAVSIVTAEDIRSFGYRTLGDIINGMRGLYTSYDRQYTYMGGRGFGRAGDYPGRVMLLIDGYQANDNLYNAAYLGHDGLLDVELIERVEYVSGPGSVAYGNGAFYGIINVITKKGMDYSGAQLAADFASHQSRKQRITYGNRLENGADFLLSASTYRSDGQTLFFPEFRDAGLDGHARNLDEEKNKRLFLKGKFEGWSLESAYVSRYKDDPTGSFGADFGVRPSNTRDTNGFINLNYDTAFSKTLDFSFRTYYGQYNYEGKAVYGGIPFQEFQTGRWWGLESKVLYTGLTSHKIILGTEYRNDYQQDFRLPDATIAHSNGIFSLYLQDEYQLSSTLAINYGLRADHGSDNLSKISPRLAFILTPTAQTTFKASYSTAFRRPNAYEKYYTDGSTLLANPKLQNEQVKAYELVWEHRPVPTTRILGSLYAYSTQNIIVDVPVTSTLERQFINGRDSHVYGADIELERHFDNHALLRTSYASQLVEDWDGLQMENTPKHLAKFNLSLPIVKSGTTFGIELIHIGQRPDKNRDDLDAYTLTNLTLASREVIKNTEASLSVKNVFNQHYAVSAPSYMLPASLQQDGRSFWLQLVYQVK